jgi:hypothetical protein
MIVGVRSHIVSSLIEQGLEDGSKDGAPLLDLVVSFHQAYFISRNTAANPWRKMDLMKMAFFDSGFHCSALFLSWTLQSLKTTEKYKISSDY